MKEIRLKLWDITTNKIFYKNFDTEFERYKFKSKLKYSKKLVILLDI